MVDLPEWFIKDPIGTIPVIKLTDPLWRSHQFFVGITIILIFVAIWGYMYFNNPKVPHEKLSQTDFVTKLAQDNSQLELQAGIELAKQVQLHKEKRSKETQLQVATEALTKSTEKVLELDGKIKANREKMYEVIIK